MVKNSDFNPTNNNNNNNNITRDNNFSNDKEREIFHFNSLKKQMESALSCPTWREHLQRIFKSDEIEYIPEEVNKYLETFMKSKIAGNDLNHNTSRIRSMASSYLYKCLANNQNSGKSTFQQNQSFQLSPTDLIIARKQQEFQNYGRKQ
ncbi:hypothetical protein [Aureivirga marina]|uniref:hypothetical protein n=1 Tax=Aureivirga marina TaxID=1182451 RepID=UPI0018CBBB31|nr:hypothetical protein [Aureivirga marina]